jgi:cytochrome c biogenesis protein CcdA
MVVALLYVAVFAGGPLTIFSPCILPIVPCVFARTGIVFDFRCADRAEAR